MQRTPPPRSFPSVAPPAADEMVALRLEVEQLKEALATRDMIWTAKTVIAATTGCSPEEAHDLLVRQSQFEHRKLREVAMELVSRHASSPPRVIMER